MNVDKTRRDVMYLRRHFLLCPVEKSADEVYDKGATVTFQIQVSQGAVKWGSSL